jgi:hypothetical protein
MDMSRHIIMDLRIMDIGQSLLHQTTTKVCVRGYFKKKKKSLSISWSRRCVDRCDSKTYVLSLIHAIDFAGDHDQMMQHLPMKKLIRLYVGVR